VSADGIRIVFGSPVRRNLLLFGWLAGFYIVPEGLAAPYAHSLHGTAFTVGLLMAAMPLGAVIGAVVFGRLVAPSEQIRTMGWMAMLACAPLIGSAWNPPLGVVLALWALAGVGGAFQLAAVSAFVRALQPGTRARAFGVAQSGLFAVQGLGILAAGAVAETIGAPMAVGLAGVLGLCAATGLAMSWTQLRGKVIADQRNRVLRPVLVDERLRYRGVLTLLRDDGPRDDVYQEAEPIEDRKDSERKPDKVRVHPEVRGKTGTNPCDDPALPPAEEPLAPAAVIFAHVYDHAHSEAA
jgi:MFS family permease